MVQEPSKNAKTLLPYRPGDILTVQAEHGKFAVMKILAIDEAGVDGLVYAQLFEERPRIVNIDELQIGYFVKLACDDFILSHPEITTEK